MQLLSSFLKLLVALALQASHTQQWDRFSRNSTSEGQVLPFQEVWGRSFCRPLEMLVDIVSEYPSEVEHMFSPSCISLQRCTGCCGDETLQCVPVETANVTMQLLKMKPVGQVPYVELSFTEHRQCACRPRRDTLKSGRRRPKGRGKRKREKQRPKGCDLIAEPKLIGAASLGGRRSEAETACSGFLCSYTEQGCAIPRS